MAKDTVVINVRLDRDIAESVMGMAENFFDQKVERSEIVRAAVLGWLVSHLNVAVEENVVSKGTLDNVIRDFCRDVTGGGSEKQFLGGLGNLSGATVIRRQTATLLKAMDQQGIRHRRHPDPEKPGERFVKIAARQAISRRRKTRRKETADAPVAAGTGAP